MNRCEQCNVEYEGEQHECAPPPNGGIMARMERVATVMEAREAGRDARTQELITAALEGFRESAGIGTPSRTEGPATATIRDRFDQQGWGRGDAEVAMMLFDASQRVQNPQNLVPPEDLVRRWHHDVFEAEGTRLGVVDDKGTFLRAVEPRTVEETRESYQRAMDTAESGYGSQLIGAQYVTDLWEAARNEDSLVGDIRQIPMTAPTAYVPIDGGLPEMLLVGESVTEGASNYGTSKTPSNRVTLTAKKFTIQQIWSGELDEDSIIAFVPFLREKLAQSAAVHLGSAFLNGDTTGASTGNINKDDGTPAVTKHYLAWDGIRHYWLVDTSTQGKDMATGLNPDEIWRARGKMSGQGADIDGEIKTINWGKVARDLRLVMDWDTFMAMHKLGEVLTVDKYGPQATVISGELGSYGGIPIISPPYASKTEADGKASDTEGNNTKGQITLLNPAGFLSGVRRDMQFFMDRIQRTDQFLIETYSRIAFTRHGENVAAGIYDITV